MSRREFYCERCGERLNPTRMVWLELNMHTDTYHAHEGEVPEHQSQGQFSFGAACARRILAAQAEERP